MKDFYSPVTPTSDWAVLETLHELCDISWTETRTFLRRLWNRLTGFSINKQTHNRFENCFIKLFTTHVCVHVDHCFLWAFIWRTVKEYIKKTQLLLNQTLSNHQKSFPCDVQRLWLRRFAQCTFYIVFLFSDLRNTHQNSVFLSITHWAYSS